MPTVAGELGAETIDGATNAVDTDISLYEVPAGKRAIVNINAVNRHAQTRDIQIAVTDQASPADEDWIEFGNSLSSNGVLERTQIVMAAGEEIFVQSDGVDVNFKVYGFEEDV